MGDKGQPQGPPPGQPQGPPPGHPQGPPPGHPQGPPPGQPGQPGQQGYAYNAQGQAVQGYPQPPPGQPMYAQGQAPPPAGGYGPPGGGQQMQGYYVGQPGAPGQPGQPGQPVQQGQPGQPGQSQVQWMARPETIPGCPPGLEYLTQIDQILIHQQIELFEVFTNWETQNRYQIKNSLGQQVYFAQEESDTCHRQCCGPNRGFTMHITDNLGQEVIRINREFKCCAGCNCCAGSGCCSMEVEIEAPVGQVVGYVKQQASCLAPKYAIEDGQNQTILMIQGPTCICQGPCCTWDQEFIVQSADTAHEVGKISKQWSGFVKEYFTQADNFGVSFPMDLDVKMKAVMVGAVFLIDFMFFEQKNNNQH